MSKWTAFKWIVLVGAFLGILGYAGYAKYTALQWENRVHELETEMAALTISLENAQGKITLLTHEAELKSNEAGNISELLDQCYKNASNMQKDFSTIDNIMNLTPIYKPVIEQPTEVEEHEQSENRINENQNKAGIDFVNSQLDAIK